MLRSMFLRTLCVAVALALALPARMALADGGKSTANSAPTFGSRTDNPDGSAAVTMGRSLPLQWDAKVGADVNFSAPESPVLSENLLRGVTPNQSSGAVWGTLTMPGVSALGFDKTSVNARLDAGSDKGQIGATLSRSLPLGQNLSMTLQNDYSVTQTLATATPAVPMVPLAADASSAAPVANPSATWAVDQSLRFNINPSGTTVSVGAGTSTADTLWHNKVSLEQTLFGPLKVTTSLEDTGTSESRQSITAGFKRTW